MENTSEINDDLRPEYDFAELRGGVQGKYFERFRRRHPVVELEPDVAAAFPTAEAVNAALRQVLQQTPQPSSTPASPTLTS